MKELVCLLVAMVCLSGVPLFAATQTAATCSQVDVQTAVNAAAEQDTVQIPAGTCVWTAQVAVRKGLTLQGAGQGITVIVDNLPKNGNDTSAAFLLQADSPKSIRLTSFSFRGMAADPNIYNKGHVVVSGTTTAFRIDHITVTNSQTSFIRTEGCPYGLIDHLDYTGDHLAFNIYHSSCNGSRYGDGSWAMPIEWGSAKAIYIEDSILRSSSGLIPVYDGFQGSRVVIRHNQIINGTIVTHGTDTGGRLRSQRYLEIYENDFTTGVVDALIWIRGGTGIFFNNRVTAEWMNFFVKLTNCREKDSGCGSTGIGGWPPFGACDGLSPYDQNTQTGYRCVDQPGAGTSRDLGGLDIPTSGWVGNTLDPAYVWNNALSMNPKYGAAAGSASVREGRDFYVNTPRPGYTPYTYPHPLQSGSLADVVPSGDSIAPIPANAGVISSGVMGTSATLTWSKASDNLTLQPALQYEVRLSTNSDIDTVAKAESYGAIVKAYATDINSAVVAGLTAGATYYFNVIVKDEAGNKGIYQMTSATAAAPDTAPPVPGNSGSISSNATSSTATLGWVKATDDTSAPSALQYEVRRSGSNNMGTVATAETYGVVVQMYVADIGSANVTGLAPNTPYYFNVIVRDAAGNKSVYIPKSVTTATAPDSTAPIPGNGGSITSSSIGASTAILNWSRATDDISTQAQLMYEVRRSSSNNLDTVLRAEAYGAIVQGYTADNVTATMTGLSPETTYYFNVIVKDAAGNRAVYTTKSLTTAAVQDTSAPVPGNSGAIASGSVGANGVVLNWSKATDNTSTQAQLSYEVRRSLAGNIDTVARAEANGLVAQNYLADISSATIMGLNPGTTYFFTVIVRDAAGNKSVYSTMSATTTGDTTPPVPGSSGLITSNANSSSITVNWAKASDNVSAQPTLRYEVRLSNSNNITTVASAESNGTIVKPYTADISTFAVNGLVSGTDYYINVIVKDEANNKSSYATKMEATTGKRITQLNPNAKGPRKYDDPAASIPELPAADTTPPTPGLAGQIAISGISTTGLTLRWTTATDNVTAKADLLYEVLTSSTRNLSTVVEAESNGSLLLAFTPDTSSFVVKNLPNAIQQFFTVVVKDGAGNKSVYATAGNLGETYTYLSNGGIAFGTASATTSPLTLNQLKVTPAEGTLAPAGLALVRTTSSRGVVSTAGLPLSGGIRTGNLYADMRAATETTEAVRTGIALANPSAQDAEISFFFTDANGVEIKSGLYMLLANHQLSGFLDESPFNGPAAFRGTFTFSSSAPISAIGTRSLTQRSGEFLLQSLPISTASPVGNSSTIPSFVDGGGWATEVILTNPSSSLQVGTVQFWGHGAPGIPAAAVEMTVNGSANSTFSYSIPPRSIVRMVTSGAGTEINSGSIRITSTGAVTSGGVPDAVAILSSRSNGTTVSEATLAALPTGTAFRSYVETASSPDWVSSSVAISNPSGSSNTVNLQLTRLDGSPVASTSVTLPANGQISVFVVDLFPGLENGFQGLLRLNSSGPVGFAAFRCISNAAGDFLFASTPPHNDDSPLPSSGLAFPLVASGAGYDTQVVLFGQSGQAGTGEMMFISKDGVPQPASSLGVTQ